MADIKPNEKQQQCIDNINGKYLVLAGPGTGKTFTLIQRIKSMIEKGVNPEKILCLTFSDAAANEMRSRLDKELNKLNSGVNIYTYHGFCNEIIKENPIDFELPEDFKIITTAVSRTFLKECIDEITPVAFRSSKNDPYVYLKTISDQIEAVKANRLSKEQYFKNLETNPDWEPQLQNLKTQLKEKTEKGDKIPLKLTGAIETLEKKIAKAKELWKFYELYKSKMEQEHYLDFNDMIGYVLDKFETEPSFLSKIANNYEYILVDEYQDTNKNQNDIVFNLTRSLDSENVFVVGDDDQIIFSFQGARLDTIERFLKEFPDTKVICLTENMRSTQSILDVSRQIAMQDSRRLENNSQFKQYNIDKKLIAKNEKIASAEKPVRCYKYADILQEYTEIIDEIENIVNSSACPVDDKGNKKLSEIAILARSHAELTSFAEMLKDRNIPFEVKDGKSIFEIKSSIVLYYYMQLLVNPEMYADKAFRLLLLKPFNIHPKDFETVYNKTSQYKSFIDAIKSIEPKNFLHPESITKFVETFDYLQTYKTNETLKNIILEIGSKTGIFNYYINSEINQTENIAGLKKIVDEAIDFSQVHKKIGLEDFVEYLNIALTDDIAITTDKAPIPLNAVQLSTYHSSKGREFEYVYMPTLLRDKWESRSETLKPIIPLDPSEYKTDDELKEMKRSDKIKLMYVGMTRAKHTLRLSYPQSIAGKNQTPTAFIVNIQDMFEKEPEQFEYDINSFWQVRTKSLLKRDYDYKKDFYSMVDAAIEGRAFSPSSINMYLKCPRQYLYNYVLGLQARVGNPDAFSFGTSVHSACEYAVDYAKTKGQYPSKESFLEVFRNKLNSLPMSSYQQREIHIGRGEKVLNEFYVQICNTPISWLHAVEQPVKFEMDGVKFFGVIDRVDKNEDGTYTIYDYKTGKAKTNKMICPEGEYEEYYNQIGLYKLYFEKSTGKKVRETTFIFPEEYTKNLTVNLTDEDCNLIEQKFRKAISDIKAYNFEPSNNEKACKWCAYKDFCNMEVL